MSLLLQVLDVEVVLEGQQILKDVHLRIGRGDFVGILGPNGSGKTTLLRTLARAITPHRGTVLLEGKNLQTLPTRKVAQKVAVVAQTEPIAFDFTVAELVSMGRNPYQSWLGRLTQQDRQAVYQALQKTNLLGVMGRKIGTLSGGELQRVLLARALAQEPELLLLDEPTSHLDIAYQIELLTRIRELNRERALTVIAVLHDLSLASAFCDRLILMKGGQIVAMGIPEEVLQASLLQEVYGVEVVVSHHPLTGHPIVLSNPPLFVQPPRPGYERGRVHVIGGGGSSASLLRALVRAGYLPTLGVINQGDTDYEGARALGLEMAEEAPFSAISEPAKKKAQALIEQAEVVIVAELPFGPGNLANLQLVYEAQQRGKPIVWIETSSVFPEEGSLSPNKVSQESLEVEKLELADQGERPILAKEAVDTDSSLLSEEIRAFVSRDFTGGRATELYRKILAGGVFKASSTGEVLEILATLCKGTWE